LKKWHLAVLDVIKQHKHAPFDQDWRS
jgi:hypothetical protein